ncbi:MAG: scavenger receptor cysteine-rich domain-containing protein, partial [Bdellovibrionota bacterium]
MFGMSLNAVTAIAAEGDLRLTGREGILEISHNGEFRGVCDDSFDREDAQVACAQLGGSLIRYSTGMTGFNDQHWVDDLACRGDERYLDQCPRSSWGVENCGAAEHVAVECDFRSRDNDPRGPGRDRDRNQDPR